MENKRILFVCTYHGARSLIAEAFAKLIAPGKVEVHSACFDPGKIGPLPIEVMRETGIDLPAESPKSVFKRYKEGESFNFVISLCHEATTEECPLFKKSVDTLYQEEAERISWSIPGFESLSGTEEEKMARAREIRDALKAELVAFLAQIGINTELA